MVRSTGYRPLAAAYQSGAASAFPTRADVMSIAPAERACVKRSWRSPPPAGEERAFLDAAVVMALLDFNLRLGRKAPHVNRSFANRCPLVGDSFSGDSVTVASFAPAGLTSWARLLLPRSRNRDQLAELKFSGGCAILDFLCELPKSLKPS